MTRRRTKAARIEAAAQIIPTRHFAQGSTHRKRRDALADRRATGGADAPRRAWKTGRHPLQRFEVK